MLRSNPLGELPPVHPRHHDVGDQHVELARLEELERLHRCGDGDDRVPMALELLDDELPDLALVLDEEHSLRQKRMLRLVIREGQRCGCRRGRERKAERRARAEGRLDCDEAAGALDDPVDGGQAEPGAAIRSLSS